jgi:hypothetical protein
MIWQRNGHYKYTQNIEVEVASEESNFTWEIACYDMISETVKEIQGAHEEAEQKIGNLKKMRAERH